MKKIVWFLALIFAIGMSYAAVNTQYAGKAPNILVNLLKQEPDSVEPGSEVELTFKIDNNGTTASNFAFEILPEYPFILVAGEDAVQNIGELGSSQGGRQSATVRFKLKVALDASDGGHNIKARYRLDNYDSWIMVENFLVKIQSQDAVLAVEKISTVPSVIVPGEKAKLRIDLRNYAGSVLRNIRVSLNLEKSGDETRPFSPVGSSNEKFLNYLEPQSSIPIEFDLLADSDASSKAYKIPLTIKYSDSLSKNYSRTSIIGIIIGDTPDIGVSLERTEIFTSGDTGSVVLRIVNMGNPDIKFLNVKVLGNDNVSVIGGDESYIGKLDSDDFSTAEFKLLAKGKERVNIPVQLEYKDTNNNAYKEAHNVPLRLYSSSEARSIGVKKGGKATWIIAMLAIAGVAYYYFRKRRK